MDPNQISQLISTFETHQVIEKFKQILENIHRVYSNSKDSEKYLVLAALAGTITRSQLERIGVRVTSLQYQKSLNKNNRARQSSINISTNSLSSASTHSIPQMPSNSPSKAKQQHVLQIITEKLVQNSRPSSRRINIGKTSHEIRYLEKTRLQIFNELVEEGKIDIKRSRFYDLIPRYFQNGKKKTDYCRWCAAAAKDRKTLLKLDKLEQSGRCDQDHINIKNNIINNLQKFQLHETAKTQQKNNYQQLINQLPPTECLVITDFKENIKIGGSPVETGQEYFHKRQVSVLGFACIYKEGSNTTTKYFDFFSYCLSHTSFFAKSCFKQLLDNEFFKRFNVLHIWADGGKHFRSSEYAHFALFEIPALFSMKTYLNYFIEYHGKSRLDGHFGLISKWLHTIELSQRIVSISNLIENLHIQIRNTNIGSGRVEFFEFDPPEADPSYVKINIKDFTSLFSFYQENGIVFGKALSTYHDYYVLNAKKVESKESRILRYSPPNILSQSCGSQLALSTATIKQWVVRQSYMGGPQVAARIALCDHIQSSSERTSQ